MINVHIFEDHNTQIRTKHPTVLDENVHLKKKRISSVHKPEDYDTCLRREHAPA